jgi:C4-type Zn-finger protein
MNVVSAANEILLRRVAICPHCDQGVLIDIETGKNVVVAELVVQVSCFVCGYKFVDLYNIKDEED